MTRTTWNFTQKVCSRILVENSDKTTGVPCSQAVDLIYKDPERLAMFLQAESEKLESTQQISVLRELEDDHPDIVMKVAARAVLLELGVI